MDTSAGTVTAHSGTIPTPNVPIFPGVGRPTASSITASTCSGAATTVSNSEAVSLGAIEDTALADSVAATAHGSSTLTTLIAPAPTPTGGNVSTTGQGSPSRAPSRRNARKFTVTAGIPRAVIGFLHTDYNL